MPASRVQARAPGRLNLIGEHTDYNDGLALAFAIDRDVVVTAERTNGSQVECNAVDLGEADRFSLADPGPSTGWRAFVRGAVFELQHAGFELVPSRLAVTGTVPRGSGLSSSAAVEVSVCLALLGIAGYTSYDRLELARLCSRIENRWLNAHTGLLDQLTVLFAAPDQALLIDFQTTTFERVPLQLDALRLALKDSNAARTHADSGYNDRRSECHRARMILGLDSLRAATDADIARLQSPLDRRLRHVIAENRRVSEMAAALGRQDLTSLGELLDASHRSLRDDFEVSTPAVDRTVTELKTAGALGARLIGGGFGGHVVGLFAPSATIPSDAFLVSSAAAASIR